MQLYNIGQGGGGCSATNFTDYTGEREWMLLLLLLLLWLTVANCG
jgi:hypothetical protein